MLDRSDLLHFTLHTVLHNLGEGMILVTIILLLFLGNIRAAIDRRGDDTIFPDVRLNFSEFEPYSRKSDFTWRARFRNGRGRRRGDG